MQCCSSKSIRKLSPFALSFVAAAASAHGFGQRFDLPLPLWLWLTGAGATIVVTFVALALFVRDGSAAAARRPLQRIVALPRAASAAAALLRVAAALLFVLTISAGFFGNQNPYANLINTMVWVVWWVGCAFACALVGDLWAPLNPLRTLFVAAESIVPRFAGRRTLRYPRQLGVWPAVMLFFAFAWAELVWSEKDVPRSLAQAVVDYAVLTWIGMVVFGREVWLARGEAFGIAFGVLARFAPLACEPPSPGSSRPLLLLRLPGSGLATPLPVPPSLMVFVLLMLASVTFDGFKEVPLMQQLDTTIHRWPPLASLLFDLSEFGLDESRTVQTALLLLFPIAFVLAFRGACALMLRITPRDAGAPWPTTTEAACAFVLTLVPIAVAYHLSHYASLLLTAGQFIIPLVSDPFGFGWNLFGSAGYKVDLALVSPYVFWYSAVTIVVIGHVVAVVLAHGAALRLFGSRRAALRSQLPMLALMVGYTTLSLWILAQPIVG